MDPEAPASAAAPAAARTPFGTTTSAGGGAAPGPNAAKSVEAVTVGGVDRMDRRNSAAGSVGVASMGDGSSSGRRAAQQRKLLELKTQAEIMGDRKSSTAVRFLRPRVPVALLACPHTLRAPPQA